MRPVYQPPRVPSMRLAGLVGFWYNGGAVLPTPAADGGVGMEFIASFFVSAAANATAYYICKWLDRHNKEQCACHSKKRTPESAYLFRGPLFSMKVLGYNQLLSSRYYTTSVPPLQGAISPPECPIAHFITIRRIGAVCRGGLQPPANKHSFSEWAATGRPYMKSANGTFSFTAVPGCRSGPPGSPG